jgi:hypothetical protein
MRRGPDGLREGGRQRRGLPRPRTRRGPMNRISSVATAGGGVMDGARCSVVSDPRQSAGRDFERAVAREENERTRVGRGRRCSWLSPAAWRVTCSACRRGRRRRAGRRGFERAAARGRNERARLGGAASWFSLPPTRVSPVRASAREQQRGASGDVAVSSRAGRGSERV